MNWLPRIKPSAPNNRVILVVTAQRVSWYRCQKGLIIDRLQHRLDDELPSIITNCAWLKSMVSSNELSAELIIDTELDDLDRVKLVDTNHRLSRPWQTRKVLWRLRREYPDAIVNSLPDYLYPEIASVLYSQLSKQSQEWLAKLCECGILVSHSVSSSQLLMDCYRHNDIPVLLYLLVGVGKHRLLLSQNGLPLYMRQALQVNDGLESQQKKVDVDTDTRVTIFANNYLNETLEYFNGSVFASVDKVLVVLPQELQLTEEADFSDEYLAQYLLGTGREVSSQQITLADVGSKGSYGDSFNFAQHKSDDGQGSSNVTVLQIKRPDDNKKPNRYSLLKSVDNLRAGLEQSVITLVKRKREQRLKKCTVLMCSIFAVSVLVSAFIWVTGIRERERYREDYATESLLLNEQSTKAERLHSSPEFAMESIERVQGFNDQAIPAPSDIVSVVAKTVQESTAVSLTGFSWAAAGNENDDSVLSVSTVSIRDRYWGDEPVSGLTLVEMSGKIVSNHSLRKKQGQLDDFIAGLKKSEVIGDLQILSSPAKSASSSHTLLESEGDFTIQFSIKSI